MRFEKETVVILLLIAIVLGPMWFFALESAESESPVVLSQNEGAIDPTETFLPTPVEVNELVAGVITWLGLFALVGMIYYTHQFIRTLGQARESVTEDEPADAVTTDGGQAAGGRADGGVAASLPSYLLAGDRRLADYWPAQYATPGVVGIAIMSWSAVTFTLLFVMEALSWARTQYLGVYAGMVFLSLGVVVAVYTTWFIPSMHVVEGRGHEEKITEEADDANQ
jgi:hypothetical protein